MQRTHFDMFIHINCVSKCVYIKYVLSKTKCECRLLADFTPCAKDTLTWRMFLREKGQNYMKKI